MYVSIGYQSGQYTNTDLTNLSNANHLVISVGKNMSAYYALEGVYASGMSDSSSTSLGTAINLKLTTSYRKLTL